MTSEIIVLLENGYADGAMARWRTLHEISIVSSTIMRFGEEIAERYVNYQIVESYHALMSYEKNHRSLGFKAVTKKHSKKIRNDYKRALHRYGESFGLEYGWTMHHLKKSEKDRITFARLEETAAHSKMRSPYKMASYNVHASPKGVYFKLGSLDGAPMLLAGASNAGLVEPAQHTAASLIGITLLIMGESSTLDDVVMRKVMIQFESDLFFELGKAHKKLIRDDKRHRKMPE